MYGPIVEFVLPLTFLFLPWLLIASAHQLDPPIPNDRGGDAGAATVSPTVLTPPEHAGRSPLAVPLAAGAATAVSARCRRRVVIYARYSTVEQDPRSIDDQIARCREFIGSLGLSDVEITVFHDAALSGELTHRPGIDRVWDLIESESCDVIVAENMSRYYRQSTRAMQFIEAAVDAGIRLIAINSNIDTAEDEGRWRMGSFFASMKAEMDNRETRLRIMRAMEARWRDGHAVGALKPGYSRIATRPATEREPAQGPFRDERDEQHTPTIEQVYKMCAAGDPLWVIAEYLGNSGLPKSARGRLTKWTEANVLRLLRDPIYRGEERWRVRRNVRKFKQGKSVQELSPSDKIVHRDMPHLAHVPPWLWEKAIGQIDKRNRNKNPGKGKEHSLYGKTLDSRGALSQLFVCGVCGAKMYRNPDYYRCANCRATPILDRIDGQRCWNRCLPQTQIVHRNLAQAIVSALEGQAGCFDALCAEVKRQIQEGAPEVKRRIEELRKNEGELDRACKRLAEAVERAGDLDELLNKLRDREVERRQVRLEMERLTHQNESEVPPPTGEDIRRMLDDVKQKLLGDFGPEVGPLLRRLVDGKIRAMPYMPIDGTHLRLRAHFKLNLLKLLPEQWQALLEDRATPEDLAHLADTQSLPLVVDLFDLPSKVRHARAVHKLVISGFTIAEAARRLRLSETSANRANTLGKTMAARGLEDAYVEVKSVPEKPKKWCSRGHWPGDQEQE